MKKWVLMLGVSFLSFSSFATDYKLDAASCINFEEIEEIYRKDTRTDAKLLYASCLLVKGVFIEDESLVTEGLKMLKEVVENEDHIVANYNYGLFYYTKGNFGKTIAIKNLKLVEENFLKTLEYIKKNPSYPNEEYVSWEEASSIEMGVYSKLPIVYLQMYYLSIIGDIHERLQLEDEDTFLEYRKDENGIYYSDTHYINLAKKHAESCKDLGDKDHFRETAKLYQEACAMQLDMADKLIEIQEERKTVLENCGEDVSEKACFDEIHELTLEFVDIYDFIFKESAKIHKKGEEGEDLRSVSSE